MAKYLVLLLVLAAGLSQPAQVAMHAKLAKTGGSPFLAAIASSATALLIAIGLWLASGSRGSFAQLAGAPWWAWLPGFVGVLVIVGGLLALPLSGVALVIAVMVFGQLTASLVVDHFGWLEVKRQPINAWRVAGVLTMFVGVLLMQKK